jgi:hypothetical protein
MSTAGESPHHEVDPSLSFHILD